MKGKIFTESENIYQDQARILFNYYQQMAEKIVNEEERIEKEILKLEEEKAVLDKEISKAKMLKWVLCIFVIPFIYYMIKENGLAKQIGLIETRINEFRKLHKEIFRDYKVTKLGVAYVPIANQIKYENKSFMVDYSGMVDESEITLQLPKQNDLLVEKIADLERLSAEAPMVESSNEIEEIDTDEYSRSMQQLNQHDYFGGLERSLRTISFCMDDLNVTSVSLPLVTNDSSYLNFINEHATSEVPIGATVLEVFNTSKYDEDISKFTELNKLKDSLSKDTAQFEDVLKGLMVTMAQSVQAISALKVASTDKIVFESNKILYKILKSPYNHYSPTLEASEIERIKNETFNYGDSVQDYVPFHLKKSSRVKYNLLSDTWTAEDNSTTNFPFGIHQLQEEIVAPIVQNLMNETRIERLKIYNHIKDQKIDYLNKWHQDTEDFYGRNRSESADLINLMRASLRDYVAAYNTMASLKKTEDSMKESGGSLDSTVVETTDNSAEVFAAYELQSKEFQKVQANFESYMDRLKDDIELKAGNFEHIDYYDALLRDGNSRDSAVATSEVHELDERRKQLATVNPLFAKNSEIPPAPGIENITYEHISLNLPVIARNALLELDSDSTIDTFNFGDAEGHSAPVEDLKDDSINDSEISQSIDSTVDDNLNFGDEPAEDEIKEDLDEETNWAENADNEDDGVQDSVIDYSGDDEDYEDVADESDDANDNANDKDANDDAFDDDNDPKTSN